MLPKKALILLTVIVTHTINASFAPNTLVKTTNGFKPISECTLHHNVICYGKNCIPTERPIINCYKKHVEKYLRITVNGEVIEVSHDQKFYDPLTKKWVEAQTLLEEYPNRQNLNYTIEEVNQDIDLYDITVADYHNFCISHQNIVVHNLLPAFTPK